MLSDLSRPALLHWMTTRTIVGVFGSGNAPTPSSLVDWSQIPDGAVLTAVVADVPNDKIALAVTASFSYLTLRKFVKNARGSVFRTAIFRKDIRVEGHITVTASGKVKDNYPVWSCILGDSRHLHLPSGFFTYFGATAEVVSKGDTSSTCQFCGAGFWGGDECHGCIMRCV